MERDPPQAGDPDPFDLGRFVSAQAGVYAQALAELRAGRKRSHWMWFVFPQFAGLGASPTSRHFAIRSLAEAQAYLRHSVLGPRLAECVRTVNGIAGATAQAVFGAPDDAKFRSSMTLFEAAGGGSDYSAALGRYFAGERDARTLELLRQSAPPPAR